MFCAETECNEKSPDGHFLLSLIHEMITGPREGGRKRQKDGSKDQVKKNGTEEESFL